MFCHDTACQIAIRPERHPSKATHPNSNLPSLKMRHYFHIARLWAVSCTLPTVAALTLLKPHIMRLALSKIHLDDMSYPFKHILRYLKGTSDVGIVLKTVNSYRLEGYADADFANDLTDPRSTSGFIFVTNGPICWKSRRQQLTALSTTEAEVNALCDATKEAS